MAKFTGSDKAGCAGHQLGPVSPNVMGGLFYSLFLPAALLLIPF
jgi:hypothetical protein